MKKKHNTIISRNYTKEGLLTLLREFQDVSNIAKHLNVNRATLYYAFRQHDIVPQQVKFDHNFFHSIDNESKAYWLGFICADGCVFDKGKGSKSLHIRLATRDEDHIKLFKRCLSCYLKTHRCKQISWIKLCSNQLCNDLIEHGCTPRKSLSLNFPTLPSNITHHFVRGYFDGDGSVMVKQNNSVRITIIGTKPFLNKLQIILSNELGISIVKLGKSGKAFVYEKSGNIQVKKIYEWLYKDATLFLQRKYRRFPYTSSSGGNSRSTSI